MCPMKQRLSGYCELSFGGLPKPLHHPIPLAALAKKSLDQFAKCAVASARIQFPCCSGVDLGRCVGGGGGEAGAQHWGEIGEIVADVEHLIEGNIELVEDL